MNLSELQVSGGFVDTTPVKKEITWQKPGGDPLTFDVYVVRQPFGAVERAFDGETDRSKGANMIQMCIRLGDGTEQLTYEQAYNLHTSLAWAFVAAINEVHNPKS